MSSTLSPLQTQLLEVLYHQRHAHQTTIWNLMARVRQLNPEQQAGYLDCRLELQMLEENGLVENTPLNDWNELSQHQITQAGTLVWEKGH